MSHWTVRGYQFGHVGGSLDEPPATITLRRRSSGAVMHALRDMEGER